MVITFVLSGGAVLVAVRILVEQRKSRALTRMNWDDVVAQLEPTATRQITLIAIEFLNPGQSAFITDASTWLVSLGGIQGLQKMRRNGDVLIALAAQAERWNPQATRSLVTQMRRDGAELKHAALPFLLRLLDEHSERGRTHIQRAAVAYYRMIYHLLDSAREFSPADLSSLNRAIYS